MVDFGSRLLTLSFEELMCKVVHCAKDTGLVNPWQSGKLRMNTEGWRSQTELSGFISKNESRGSGWEKRPPAEKQ